VHAARGRGAWAKEGGRGAWCRASRERSLVYQFEQSAPGKRKLEAPPLVWRVGGWRDVG